MGFLTPFSRDEMLEATLVLLGLHGANDDNNHADGNDDDDDDDAEDGDGGGMLKISQRANNHMQIEATTHEGYNERPPLAFGNNGQICISMRMRLDCRIFGSDGSLLSQ